MSDYGSVPGVVAYVRKWTDNGEFTNEDCLDCLQEHETIPPLRDVQGWLEDFSATMNTALAGAGFVTPIATPLSAKRTIDMIVNQYVADMVKYANNTGRFVTDRAKEYGIEPVITISKNIYSWVTDNADGLEAQGAARGSSQRDSIGSKKSTPIFQRDAFGNKFTGGPSGNRDE